VLGVVLDRRLRRIERRCALAHERATLVEQLENLEQAA